MTTDQMLVFGVLIATLALFVWGRYRYDVVAVGALAAVVLTGLVPPGEAFRGLGHPAVVTVAAVLVVSHALRNSGVVDMIARWLIPLTRHPVVHIVMLTALVTVASAFMNNVGALALMLPVALTTAAEHDRSPAVLLMPMAFGSILGGMTTMIGTPPNIIIANYRGELSGEKFGMFDFSPVGVAVALAGLGFVTLVGWRLIPRERRTRNSPQQLFEIEEYITELRVPESSPLVGISIADVEALQDDDIDLIGLARGRGRIMHSSPEQIIGADDVLVVRADPGQLKKFIDTQRLELITSATPAFYELTSDNLTLAEGIVAPGAPIEGRGLEYLRRRTGRGLALVALARQGEPVRRRLARQVFRAGDVLLVQGSADTMDEMFAALGLLPLAGRDLALLKPRRVGLALAIFAAAIASAATGVVPIAVALTCAVLLYVVVDILPITEIYKEVDWPVIVLLAALIPVGQAMEATGTTGLMAATVVRITGGMPHAVVLTIILVATMFLSDVINNAATAVIMAPIAASIAQTLGVNTDPFLMAVAVGASCAFLTPIGHQSNTLVMGPGGYRFGDYWRMGLPLEVLIVLLGVPMILIVWPF